MYKKFIEEKQYVDISLQRFSFQFALNFFVTLIKNFDGIYFFNLKKGPELVWLLLTWVQIVEQQDGGGFRPK